MNALLELAPMAEQPKSKTRNRIDLRVEGELRELVEQLAPEYGLSISAYIRLAVAERIQRDQALKRPKKRKGK